MAASPSTAGPGVSRRFPHVKKSALNAAPRCRGNLEQPAGPGRKRAVRAGVPGRSQPGWVRSCWLESESPQAYVHDTGAERASSARDHAFGDGRAVLGTEIFPGPDNRGRRPSEPCDERSVVARSVVGTLGQPGGNRDWRYDNRADIHQNSFLFSLSILHSLSRNKLASDRGWTKASWHHPARRCGGALGGWHPHPWGT